METITPRFRALNTVALLMVLPTGLFILLSVLKYKFGIEGPFDSLYPWLEQAGIKESIGWNINLLLLFGPLLALLIALVQVLGVEWHFTREQFDLRVTIQRRLFPLLILGISTVVMVILIVYLIGENT